MTKDMVINSNKRRKDPSDKKFTLPKQARDLAGQRFGRLVALEPIGKNEHSLVLWRCECDCGKICEAESHSLLRGSKRSCGCLRQEVTRQRSLRHGACINHGMSSEYHIWSSMRQRCENPKDKTFKDYGGRGIKVCKRWHDFKNFYEDMGKKPKGKSLDRHNNDGNYCPENCRWATPHEQRVNSRPKSCGFQKQREFVGFDPKHTSIYSEISINRFARQHGLCASCISACLLGKQSQHKGWKFAYLPFQD